MSYIGKLLIVASLCFIVARNGAFAADSLSVVEVIDTLKLTVHFRCTSTDLDEDYRGNGKALRRFIEAIDAAEVLEWPIIVDGEVSPEGTLKSNRRLADERARVTREWLIAHSDLGLDMVKTVSIGADYNKMTRLIEDYDDYPHKSEILDVIRTELADTTGDVDARVSRRLNDMYDGMVWKWLDDYILGDMRVSNAVVCLKKKTFVLTVAQVDSLALPDTLAVPDSTSRQRIMAIRTNLLLPLLNVGIEYPLSRHWSLEADWYYPWIWPQRANRNCIEMLSLYAGARWWMRKPKDDSWRGRTDLSGPSLGLGLLLGYYDFGLNYKGRQGEFCGASLDFTWALVLGKGPLRMEFTIGAGYVYTPSRTYHVETEGGKLLFDERCVNHWIGPTRAAVSLVFPISGKSGSPKQKR